jgi:hypothetical protein
MLFFYGKLKSLKLNEKSVQSKTFSKNVYKNTFYFTTSAKTTLYIQTLTADATTF